MGVDRDLKKATEAYWAGKLSQSDLLAEGKRLRLAHWKIQKEAGIDVIPSNDFSYYDHVLNHIQFFGVSNKWKPVNGLIIQTDIDLRLYLKDTPNTNSTLSMSSLLWEEASRSHSQMLEPLLMYLVLYVVIGHSQCDYMVGIHTYTRTGDGEMVRFQLPLCQADIP